MEKISHQYPAGAPAARRALAGVVGSGDLKVLLEPGVSGTTVVSVSTSVNNKGPVWNEVLHRNFGGGALPAVRIEINDCGATPGVVRIRIEQALDEAGKP